MFRGGAWSEGDVAASTISGRGGRYGDVPASARGMYVFVCPSRIHIGCSRLGDVEELRWVGAARGLIVTRAARRCVRCGGLAWLALTGVGGRISLSGMKSSQGGSIRSSSTGGGATPSRMDCCLDNENTWTPSSLPCNI